MERDETKPGEAVRGDGGPDLADRLLQAAVGTFDLFTVYLGERLGLYRALAETGWTTPGELAGRTVTNERYIREWLEQQAVAAILDVDDPGREPEARRFRLPDAHAAVLVDEDDLRYSIPRAIEMARVARMLPDLVEAYRTGGAPPPLPWEPEGRGEYNRAMFLTLLGKEWLPAAPEIDRRLRSDPPARVADFACGTGWSSIAMAQAYPKISVDGFDLDEDAIASARTNAAGSGAADRLRFRRQDVATLDPSERYDLVTVLEALHDMSRPVEVLRAIRRILAPGASVLIGDERIGERFTAPGDEWERYVYGWSVLACLPGAMDDPATAATGAAMRPETLRGYAERAGFEDMEVLPIDFPFLRFYRLIPDRSEPPPEGSPA
jgi:2-polyprenyl-3-methyl-5-hydroxy-6-metoxy-1,4-benzoquinol methylase